jgi:endoglucanase
VPPSPSRTLRRHALVLAAVVAGLVPGAFASAGAAPSERGTTVIGRFTEAAGDPVRFVGTALRRPLAVRARAAQIRRTSPFGDRPLYREPSGPAHAQARAWRDERPADAALIDRIAAQPTAFWLGDWTADVRAAAADRVEAARGDGALPVLVAYNVPGRDCEQHSAGGASGPAAYRDWIDDLAAGLGAGPAAVVLEPDALAALGCLSEDERAERTALVGYAAARLSRRPGVAVYIDAGNPAWVEPAEMARRLREAGVARTRGFAVNVSSFHTTARSRAYGRAISRRAGGLPFVIDTGRNGAGPAADDGWCNPPGRALGAAPTARTGDAMIDALLWVKRPGESDGSCNGGPPAGTWWPDGALALARQPPG